MKFNMIKIFNILIVILCALAASSAFNDRLFFLLEKFQLKFEKEQKRASLWLIFFTLLSLTGYFYVVYLLL